MKEDLELEQKVDKILEEISNLLQPLQEEKINYLFFLRRPTRENAHAALMNGSFLMDLELIGTGFEIVYNEMVANGYGTKVAKMLVEAYLKAIDIFFNTEVEQKEDLKTMAPTSMADKEEVESLRKVLARLENEHD